MATLNVSVSTRRVRWLRLRLGMWLIRCGAALAEGAGIEVRMNGKPWREWHVSGVEIEYKLDSRPTAAR